MHKGHRIIDGHIHYCLDIEPAYMTALLDRTETDMANLAAITHGDRVSCTPELLALKHMNPGRFWVYGSLDPCLYYRGGEDMGRLMAEHCQRLLDMGCDGIKLLEGKPQLRRALPVPDFDADCWEEFWAWAERQRVPLLWHVNDPENFWDASAVPVWAAAQGWLYDESYINNEEQYRQVLTVLERHPGLKVIFAHFFFMSAQLDRLEKIMDSYNNIMVDLTPGIEMYENFSKTPGRTAEFFRKFEGRICYGTDIASRFVYNTEGKPFNEKENLRRPEIVRDFLFEEGEITISSDGNFLHNRPDFQMHCLNLSHEALDKIMGGNFVSFTGGLPKAVDAGKVLAECAQIRWKLDSAAAMPGFEPDYRGVNAAESYFSSVFKG